MLPFEWYTFFKITLDTDRGNVYRFRWNIAGTNVKVLAIEPQNGIIGANETQVIPITLY
jgi:hypothetical protein